MQINKFYWNATIDKLFSDSRSLHIIKVKKESKHFISANTHVFKPTGVKTKLGIYYYSNIVSAHPLLS